MSISRRTLLAGAVPAALLAGCAGRSTPPASRGSARAARDRWGAVATVHPLATRAGLDAIDRGGNAVDAAVSAALMLGVVDGHNSGIGGGCFMLIRTARGEIIAFDGREVAPAAATRDMFPRHGKPDTTPSQTRPLAGGHPRPPAGGDA